MNAIKGLCLLCSVGFAFALHGAEWTYNKSTKRMTTADGWSIKIGSHSNNRLETVGNSGMVGAVPATPDRSDGTHTLDLTGTITDSADPSITYTLYKIGYYAFNGCSANNYKIGKIIFPDTLISWSMGSNVGVFGRNASTYLQVEPKNFTAGITWSGGTFSLDINDFDGELHLNGVTSVSKLTQTVGRIMPVFIYPTLQSIGANTFANLKNTPRYLMYVMQGVDVLGGLTNTSYKPENKVYLHLPSGNAAWEEWIASNTRAFADSDLATFKTRFPDSPLPKYVVTSGKFLNSYATIWNGDPKYIVQSEGNIGADSITPSVGTYKKKVGNGKVVFSAPEEADGYKCRGYMLETTYTDWEEAEKITVEDVNSFELEIDSAKTYRVTWLWKGNSDCSVSVGSNRGVDFGACSPAYGMYTEFEGDTKTFTASEPTYDETLGYRYEVTGWRLSKADGSVESGTGAEFVYDKSMGNVSLEWQWSVTGYRLVCQADGYLPVTTDPAADSKGYFTAGSEVSLTAVDGDLGEFYHWAGKTAKLDSFSRTVSVTLNEPITLVATPKYTWYYTGSMLTNCVGWKVGATLISKTSNLSLNGDCVSAGARLPWSTDRYAANSVHLLDLSQPIVSTTGAPLYITKNSNYSFRRISGPFLARLILPDTWKETAALSDAAALFDGQSCLSEIMPAPFPKDFSGPAGTTPYFGAIPYSGDIYLLAECFTAFGSNCGVRFSHKKTQNLYLGKQFASLGQNTFANGTGRYVCWFYGYPTSIASSRSTISDYSFYVRYPSANTSWNAYLAKHARDFAESDKTGFSKTFPEAAAAGEWPKHTFTNGYFKGTWARVWGPANGSVIVVK